MYQNLTSYLDTLELNKRHFVRQWSASGPTKFFSLYDLKGHREASLYNDLYDEVYFFTNTREIYKIHCEDKKLLLINILNDTKKVLSDWFDSGYVLRVGESFKKSLFNYTDIVVEIAPYFYYNDYKSLIEPTEISLLSDIKTELENIKKKLDK